MSLRRVDARFLLPDPVRTAHVFGTFDDWREGLEEAGVELRAGGGPVDLVVTSGEHVGEAARIEARAFLVEGKVRAQELRRLGTTTRRFLPLPSPDRPELLLPLDQPRATSYILTEWASPGARWKRARNHALATLVRHGIFPPIRPLVSLALSTPGPPLLLAASAALGVPPAAAACLEPGSGDELARGVFHVFPPASPRPAWALKYARVRNYSAPFERDERGLQLAADAGGAAAAHAPRLVGRFEVDGHHASLETAAVGRRLIALLTAGGPRRPLVETVERIAAWIVQVGRETAGESTELEPDRRRLEETVLPEWISLGITPELVAQLPPLPSVLTHNDLGSWNVVVDGHSFIAIDWESARGRSFPLWDLWYFLAHALAQLDGAASLTEQEAHFSRLFAGELGTSDVLFRWTRTAAKACSVPADAVGPLATLCWLHHGRSHVARRNAIQRHVGSETATTSLTQRAPHLWCSHPALGPRWDRWRG